MGNSSPKGELIPHMVRDDIFLNPKPGSNLALFEEPAAYQLVGGVTAHQGDDG